MKIWILTLAITITQYIAEAQEWSYLGPRGRRITNGDKTNPASFGNKIRIVYKDGIKTIFVRTNLGIQKTTDEGQTFIDVGNPNSNHALPIGNGRSTLMDFIVNENNTNELYATTSHTHLDGQMALTNKGELEVYHTVDGGENWTKQDAGLENLRWGNKFMYNLDFTKLYLTTNLGVYYLDLNQQTSNWVRETSLPAEPFINFFYKPGSTAQGYELYACGYHIYKKTNTNQNWTILTDQNTGIDITGDRICNIGFTSTGTPYARIWPLNNGGLNSYCIDNSVSYEKIYRMEPSGTWTYVITHNSPNYPLFSCELDVVISPTNDQFIFLGSYYLMRLNVQSMELVKQSFESITAHADQRAMVVDPEPGSDKIYIISDGTFGVYHVNSPETDNYDSHWEYKRNENLAGTSVGNVSSSPFRDNEINYGLWDQHDSWTFQINQEAYAPLYHDEEFSKKTKYIADRVVIKAGGMGDGYSFNNDVGRPSLIGFTGFNSTAKSSGFDGGIAYMKRFDHMPEGSFYRLNRLYDKYFSGGVHVRIEEGLYMNTNITLNNFEYKYNEKIFTPINMRSQLVGHDNHPFSRFEISSIDTNLIYLSLLGSTVHGNLYDRNYWNIMKYNNRLYKSTDRGQTWTNLSESLPSKDVDKTFNVGECFSGSNRYDGFIDQIIADPYFRSRLYIIYTDKKENFAGIYQSDDYGVSWKRVLHPYFDGDNQATTLYYQPGGSENYTPVDPKFVLGLPMDAQGVSKINIYDFKLNPNNGDPIISTNRGIYYKEGGFNSNYPWKPYGMGLQHMHCKGMDVNASFQKLYSGSLAGVFVAPLLCYTQETINLTELPNGTNFRAGNSITTNAQISAGTICYLSAGESIYFTEGFTSLATDPATQIEASIKLCPTPKTSYPPIPSGTASARLMQPTMEEPIPQDIETSPYTLYEMYPNPTNRYIKIQSKEPAWVIEKIILKDFTGKMLMELEPQQTEVEIDLELYEGNMFIVDVVIHGKRKSSKIIRHRSLKHE